MFLLFIKLRMYTRICVFYTWHENNEFFYCVFKPKKIPYFGLLFKTKFIDVRTISILLKCEHFGCFSTTKKTNLIHFRLYSYLNK